MASKIDVENLKKTNVETNEAVTQDNRSLPEKILVDIVETTSKTLDDINKEANFAIMKAVSSSIEWLNDRYGRGDSNDKSKPDYIVESINNDKPFTGLSGVEKLKNEHLDAFVNRIKYLAENINDHKEFQSAVSFYLEELERNEVMQKTGFADNLSTIRIYMVNANHDSDVYNSKKERDLVADICKKFAQKHDVELARKQMEHIQPEELRNALNNPDKAIDLIKKDPMNLVLIPQHKQTERLCMLAISKNAESWLLIKDPAMAYKTMDYALYKDKSGKVFENISEGHQNVKRCVTALENNKNAEQFIREDLKEEVLQHFVKEEEGHGMSAS